MGTVDVLILTALQDELYAVLALGGGFSEARDLGGFRYFRGEVASERGGPFTVAAAWIGEMGERTAAIRGQQLIAELDPACLAMCGICAGYRGKVSLGDVIVADQLWRYDEGKRVAEPGKEAEFFHALRTFDLQSSWKMDAAYLAREIDLAALSRERPPTKDVQRRWFLHVLFAHEAEGKPAPAEHPDRARECPGWAAVVKELVQKNLVVRKGRVFRLTDAGRDVVDEDLALHPDGVFADAALRVHVGAVATGSAVVEDPGIFGRLRKIVRATIGLEMEGTALGELAQRFQKQSILVKAVQDFADHEKDDGFRTFACKASAVFLMAFLRKFFEPQSRRARERVELASRRGRDFESELDRESPFLRRIEDVVRLRHPGASTKRRAAVAPFSGIVEVEVDAVGFSRLNLVAALDGPMTEELATRFVTEIEQPYRQRYPQLHSTLVHQGEVAPLALREGLDRRGITLQTFDQYQGLFDLTAYLDWQTRELERNPDYLPTHYVDPPAWIKLAGHRELERSENALRSLWDLLVTPKQGRFLLVLGEFGAGKTFLLRELCRQMVKAKHPVWPVLLEMSKLEKQHDLPALLGAHFARFDVPGYNFKAFQYMLSEGKIALFFDGFDELADRVTYDSATAHFDTVLTAAQGHAKVVLSSRRQHFLTEGTIHAAVEREYAKKAETAVQGGYRLVMLEPFGEPQIGQYLRNVLASAAAAEARYRLIDEVKDLLGLSHNPRMLGFIADIPEASLRAAKEERGEITSAGLYELLAKQWLDCEHQRSRRMGSSKAISRAALEKGITALAVSMWHVRAKTVDVGEIQEVLQRSSAALGEHSLDPALLTFMFASGSLLVRDSEARFSFVHRSVLEWLVAREAASELSRGHEPTALVVDEMGALMADFFAAMAGRKRAAKWARETMTDGADPIVMKNAALVLQRMGERFERVNFEGQDLRGRDFSGVDWRGANLQRADLRGVMLTGANLRGAKLGRALLARADLSKASLARADLSQADFSFARLEGVDFSHAKPIEPARFRGANLLAAKEIADEHHAALLAVGAVPPGLRETAPMWAAASSCLSVAWSPDGELVAAGRADGTILLVDTVAGAMLRVLSAHSRQVQSVAFSPDGKALGSGSYDKTVRLWDVATGRALRTFEGHRGWVLSVAFSPDGQALASGSDDKTVRLWDRATGRSLRAFEGHQGSVRSLVFSSDGQALASGSYDKTIRLWDVATGRALRTFEGHQDSVKSLAFSPDGKTLASGSDDGTVLLWEVATGRSLRTFEGHRGLVLSVAFSPDGKALASGSDDKTVRLWDLAMGHSLRIFAFEGHRSSVRSVAFSPDGKGLASGSDDETVRLWDLAMGRSLRIFAFEGQRDWVRSVAFSPDGKTLASGSGEKTVRLWDVATGRSLCTFEGHQGWVRSVAFSPHGKTLASGSDDHSVRLWDLATGRALRAFEGHEGSVRSLAFSPDGKTLASGSGDRTVRLWDLATGRALRAFEGHESAVRSVAFSPDAKTLASGSSDASIVLWDLATGRSLRIFEGHQDSVRSVAFSPDGKTLASGSEDKTVRFWDVATARSLGTFEGHQGSVLSVAFSSDGKTLASASSDHTVLLWDVATGRSFGTFEGHQGSVLSVEFSPDGKNLASGSADNTIRLWDIAAGNCVVILLALPTGWVAFTPDGRYKYSGEIAGSFWHIAGLCRFEPGEIDLLLPGELDLLLPDDADFRALLPPPTQMNPWPPSTS